MAIASLTVAVQEFQMSSVQEILIVCSQGVQAPQVILTCFLFQATACILSHPHTDPPAKLKSSSEISTVISTASQLLTGQAETFVLTFA